MPTQPLSILIQVLGLFSVALNFRTAELEQCVFLTKGGTWGGGTTVFVLSVGFRVRPVGSGFFRYIILYSY